MTAESILPKRWYGKTIYVTYRAFDVVESVVSPIVDNAILIDCNDVGLTVQIEGLDMATFLPWHTVLEVNGAMG